MYSTWLPFASACTLNVPDSILELVGEPVPVKRSGGHMLVQLPVPVQAAVVAVSGVK